MAESEKLKGLPDFLKPRLRLFLSVDLVGSTALKQRPRFPLLATDDSRDNREDGGIAAPWLSHIADFYRNFAEVFERSWATNAVEILPKYGIPAGSAPELWKANGDELIYVVEIFDRRNLHAYLATWVQALRAFRKEHIKDRRLDIKSTGWTAGFPITNSGIVFHSRVEPSGANQERDSRVLQFQLLSDWHKNRDGRRNLLRDFIGPSIDTGFRLSALATPRKFIVSVETAWLLASAHIPTHRGEPRGENAKGLFDFHTIRYDGREALKGVLGGRPYPVFWIDVMVGDEMTAAEEALSLSTPKACSRDEIITFCELFMQENRDSMFRPFIVDDPSEPNQVLPENYVEILLRWHSKLPAETKIEKVESAPVVSGATEKMDTSQVKELLGLVAGDAGGTDGGVAGLRPKKKPRRRPQ